MFGVDDILRLHGIGGGGSKDPFKDLLYKMQNTSIIREYYCPSTVYAGGWVSLDTNGTIKTFVPSSTTPVPLGYVNDTTTVSAGYAHIIIHGVITGLTGLIPGVEYYMSPTGGLICNACLADKQVPVGVALSTTELYFYGYNYDGCQPIGYFKSYTTSGVSMQPKQLAFMRSDGYLVEKPGSYQSSEPSRVSLPTKYPSNPYWTSTYYTVFTMQVSDDKLLYAFVPNVSGNETYYLQVMSIDTSGNVDIVGSTYSISATKAVASPRFDKFSIIRLDDPDNPAPKSTILCVMMYKYNSVYYAIPLRINSLNGCVTFGNWSSFSSITNYKTVESTGLGTYAIFTGSQLCTFYVSWPYVYADTTLTLTGSCTADKLDMTFLGDKSYLVSRILTNETIGRISLVQRLGNGNLGVISETIIESSGCACIHMTRLNKFQAIVKSGAYTPSNLSILTLNSEETAFDIGTKTAITAMSGGSATQFPHHDIQKLFQSDGFAVYQDSGQQYHVIAIDLNTKTAKIVSSTHSYWGWGASGFAILNGNFITAIDSQHFATTSFSSQVNECSVCSLQVPRPIGIFFDNLKLQLSGLLKPAVSEGSGNYQVILNGDGYLYQRDSFIPITGRKIMGEVIIEKELINFQPKMSHQHNY
jgi:hypothetical protein